MAQKKIKFKKPKTLELFYIRPNKSCTGHLSCDPTYCMGNNDEYRNS